MYIGRIVAAGLTPSGNAVAAYRVSSRSFPNRSASILHRQIAVMPRAGFESDLAKNPYIAYNCIRLAGTVALATNGSHTDPILEKIQAGHPLRDALTLSLLALDYEHDSLDTPRIAVAVDAKTEKAMFGIVRKDAVLVREFPLEPGKLFFLATYEKNAPCMANFDDGFAGLSAADACRHLIDGGIFADFEKPVTAAAAVWNGTDYDLAALDAE